MVRHCCLSIAIISSNGSASWWMMYRRNGYKKYAWGSDELAPMARRGKHGSAPGATIIDSMSTLKIMGLDSEFDSAVAWVKNFNFQRVRRAVPTRAALTVAPCRRVISALMACLLRAARSRFSKRLSVILVACFRLTTCLEMCSC